MGTHNSNFSGRLSSEKALEKLKHFCGYQERSHAEVKQKLYTFGLYKDEAEELISRLIEDGYLNEQRFANQFASGKLRMKGWGRLKISYELKQKQVSSVCIKNALDTLDETEYQNILLRLAKKKWAALRNEKDNFVRTNKCKGFLLKRGFEVSLIRNLNLLQE